MFRAQVTTMGTSKFSGPQNGGCGKWGAAPPAPAALFLLELCSDIQVVFPSLRLASKAG